MTIVALKMEENSVHRSVIAHGGVITSEVPDYLEEIAVARALSVF